MGRGIAEVFALYGFNVYLEDISDDILKKAINEIKDSLEKLARKGNIGNLNDILSRIRTYTSIESAVKDADLVIEAVPELEELKKKIFSEIEKYTRKDT
ncbi:MAG: 3-hydroxyacyl-CoA dehydrogenase NAD-binding domain-containing protein, partial [Candidatus Hydrogenedens sp.]